MQGERFFCKPLATGPPAPPDRSLKGSNLVQLPRNDNHTWNRGQGDRFSFLFWKAVAAIHTSVAKCDNQVATYLQGVRSENAAAGGPGPGRRFRRSAAAFAHGRLEPIETGG